MKEKEIQIKVIDYLTSKPMESHKLTTGESIQIISPGRRNVNEGPDFIDMALLKDGKIIVGKGEFHRKSSEWINHKHHLDRKYDDVILHIVFKDDIDKRFSDTLILNPSEVLNANKPNQSIDISSNEEIQHFALIRVLRKSSEIKKILDSNDFETGSIKSLKNFIMRYSAKSRRPVYSDKELVELVEKFKNSPHFELLKKINDGFEVDIENTLERLIKIKIFNEGVGLRAEVITNVLIPLALCIADKKNRINIFNWFWSAKIFNRYGFLKRKFPNINQNYIWQQQGLLEYNQKHGKRDNITSDVIENYGFAEILSFYSYGG